MLDQFSATVEKIYAAAADPVRWGSALAAVEELTGSAGAVVHILPKTHEGELMSLLGNSAEGYFIAEHVEEWSRELAPICPRIAGAARFPHSPYLVDYMLMSEREMDLDPVYDWYGSYGLRYFIGSRLCDNDDVEIVWSLQRRREHGHAQQEEIALFELLSPHVARSLTLARELGTLRVRDSFGRAMFEALPKALFALDGNGCLVFANAAAEALIRRADGLSIAGGHLRTAAPEEQRAVDRLIADASLGRVSSASSWTRVSRSNGRTPHALFVTPLRVAEGEFAGSGVRVLVVVHDPSARSTVQPDVLAAIYDLTEKEARLACAISAGHSLESAAALLRMQVATARSHLKSIFAKLGVHRQQDLVRLLTSLSSIGL